MKAFFIKIPLLIFAITISNHLFSQKTILPGYIISLEGDTLKGYINYRNWEMSPEKISFWTNQDEEATDFNATEIKMFSVANDEFISAIVKYDDASYKIENLPTNPNFNYQTDTLFLLTLVKGDKSLFYYNDKNERRKLFIKTDSGYTWLEYRKYLMKDEEGLTDLVTTSGFIIQLAHYLNDCNKLDQEISEAEYSREYLTQLFYSYYKCSGHSYEFIKKDNSLVFKFGVLAGITLTTIRFQSEISKPLYEIDFSTSINATFGLKAELFVPRNFNKWSVNNELLLTNYVVTGYFEEYINENKYSKSEVNLGFMHIRMSNMIRYYHSFGNLSGFFNIGLSNGIAVDRTDQIKTETKFYSTLRTTEKELFGDTDFWEVGLNFGLGVKWETLSFEYRYEWGSSFIGYGTRSSSTHRNYFLLGYTF